MRKSAHLREVVRPHGLPQPQPPLPRQLPSSQAEHHPEGEHAVLGAQLAELVVEDEVRVLLLINCRYI